VCPEIHDPAGATCNRAALETARVKEIDPELRLDTDFEGAVTNAPLPTLSSPATIGCLADAIELAKGIDAYHLNDRPSSRAAGVIRLAANLLSRSL
jgi:hypothetical protein